MRSVRSIDIELLKILHKSSRLQDRLRIQLENGTFVSLKPDYEEQLANLIQGLNFDREWLRCDLKNELSNIYFITQNNVKLPIFLSEDQDTMLEPPQTDLQPGQLQSQSELLYILMDQSSSMESMNNAAYEGARELIQDAPENAQIVFSTFASNVNLGSIMERQDALSTVVCRVANGSTCMFDAIVEAVCQIEAFPTKDPTKQTLILITDGQDTSSRKSHEDARAALLKMNSRRSRVVFLGANQDAVMTAQRLGITSDNALTYASTTHGQRQAFRAASEAQAAYRISGSAQFTHAHRSVSMEQQSKH